MLFRPSPELDAWRAEVQVFLRDEMHDADAHADPTDLTGLSERFERAHQLRAGARGYLAISAPVEYGGGGRPPSWKATYSYEAAYHDAPSIDTALTLAGSAIEAFGNVEQKQTLLPPMAPTANPTRAAIWRRCRQPPIRSTATSCSTVTRH